MTPDTRSSEPGLSSVPARLRCGFAQAVIRAPDNVAQAFVFNGATRLISNRTAGSAWRASRHLAQASK